MNKKSETVFRNKEFPKCIFAPITRFQNYCTKKKMMKQISQMWLNFFQMWKISRCLSISQLSILLARVGGVAWKVDDECWNWFDQWICFPEWEDNLFFFFNQHLGGFSQRNINREGESREGWNVWERKRVQLPSQFGCLISMFFLKQSLAYAQDRRNWRRERGRGKFSRRPTSRAS